MIRKLVGLTVAAVVIGAAAPAPAGAAEVVELKKARTAEAVVAFVDTGINPYHIQFRDSSAKAKSHPSTYIPGYPKNARPLRISLNERTWEAAVEKDCELWKSVEDGQLYYFPGTKIVGAISFGVTGELDCKEPGTSFRILDTNGHGTMVASRGASPEYGACKSCRIVAVQNPSSVSLLDPASSNDYAIDSIEWPAKNASWIDAQSNSWGPIASAWSPTSETGILTAHGKFVRAVEAVSKKHLAFWASGNGAAFRGGVLGHPTLLSPHLTPSAISVGGHDSGQINVWPGFPPTVVADSCSAWAAYHDKIEDSGDTVSSGTSGATPFAAGGAARILLEARKILHDRGTGVSKGVVASGASHMVDSGPLADGVFTMKEWREVTLKTATPRPKGQKEDGPVCDATYAPYNAAPINWTDVPEGYPEYVHLGYGAIDAQSHKLAGKVIEGATEMPDRSEAEQYFTMDEAARSALYEVWSQGE